MPNGKPGDHPVTDLIVHGRHPFPPDVEELVRTLHTLDPVVFNALEWAPFDWEQGRHLEEARILLRGLIESHGDPAARRRCLESYRSRTGTA
ncbi:MAG: hypothetical protein AAB016_13500 [candidate division NC10 bacterium]